MPYYLIFQSVNAILFDLPISECHIIVLVPKFFCFMVSDFSHAIIEFGKPSISKQVKPSISKQVKPSISKQVKPSKDKNTHQT